MDSEFEENIRKLRDAYNKNPSKTNLALASLLDVLKRTGYDKEISYDKYDDGTVGTFGIKDKKTLAICLIGLYMAIIGLLNINEFTPLYYFGMIFFIAGLMISQQKGFGLIFLFSHGMSGLGMMIGSVMTNIFSQAYMTDNPTNIVTYCGVCLSVFLGALVANIMYNLSDKMKEDHKLFPIIMGVYAVGITLVVLLPHIATSL